jgi:hypothetical protein
MARPGRWRSTPADLIHRACATGRGKSVDKVLGNGLRTLKVVDNRLGTAVLVSYRMSCLKGPRQRKRRRRCLHRRWRLRGRRFLRAFLCLAIAAEPLTPRGLSPPPRQPAAHRAYHTTQPGRAMSRYAHRSWEACGQRAQERPSNSQSRGKPTWQAWQPPRIVGLARRGHEHLGIRPVLALVGATSDRGSFGRFVVPGPQRRLGSLSVISIDWYGRPHDEANVRSGSIG